MATGQARTFDWAIEEILPAHPDLYLELCAAMAVAVMSRHSETPCEFGVECDGLSLPEIGSDAANETNFLLRVAWSRQTASVAERIWQTEQRPPVVERAAVGLAALLFAKLVPGGQMQVTRTGERADYWLPRLGAALEVSGTEQPRELARRHREKVAQVLSNPAGWPGHAVVCCFGATRRTIRWSYHES